MPESYREVPPLAALGAPGASSAPCKEVELLPLHKSSHPDLSWFIGPDPVASHMLEQKQSLAWYNYIHGPWQGGNKKDTSCHLMRILFLVFI